MRRMYGPDTAAASRLVGVVLIAWGLHKLNYPWLRPVEWFAPFGFLLADLLAMLAAAGLLLVTAGRLRSIADQAEQRHVQSREHLATLNQLLQVSLGGKSLSGQLTDALDIVLAAPWLALEPRGGLFLVEEGALKLFIQHNLPEAFRSTWSKVTFGQGFCGRAAAEQRVIHAADVDDRLEVGLEGPRPDGHYALPIVSGGEVSGVLVLYLPVGHRAEQEITPLRAVADVLAGMLVRKRAEAAAEQLPSRLVATHPPPRAARSANHLRKRVPGWGVEQERGRP